MVGKPIFIPLNGSIIPIMFQVPKDAVVVQPSAGIAHGKLAFESSLTSPELPAQLGQLFGVQMRTLSLDGQRVLMPERPA